MEGSSGMEGVRAWLLTLNLGQYGDQFECHGWDEMETVATMTEEDIKQFVDKPGHVRKLSIAIQNLQETQPSMAQTDPSTKSGTEGLDQGERQCTRRQQNTGVVAVRDIEDDTTDSGDSSSFEDSSGEEDATQIAVPDREASAETISHTVGVSAVQAVQRSTMITHAKNVTMAEKMKIYNIRQPEKSLSKSNLLGQVEAVVETFREEDKLFEETKSYLAASQRLQEDSMVAIAGGPGDGKTALALHLLFQYEEMGYEPLLTDDPQDFKQLVDVRDKDKKQIILIDDAFGSVCTDTAKVKSWLPFLQKKERLIKKRAGKLLIVITSRKYILADVEKEGRNLVCLKPLNIVDMTSKSLKLSFGERERILCTYFEKYNIDEESIDTLNILDAQCPHGFPHCVKLFCTNIKLRDRGEKFFENPLEFVLAEIEQFSVNDRYKYCILLMVLLMGMTLKEDELNEFKGRTDDIRRILRISGIDDGTPFTFLRDALHALNGIYIKEKTKDCGHFVFNHESIADAVSFTFTRQYPEEAISRMSLKFLTERTCLSGDSTRRKEVFEIPSKFIMALAKRFTSEILKGKVNLCFDHKAWSDSRFIETWLKYMESIEVAEATNGNETAPEVFTSTKDVLNTNDKYLFNRTLLPIAAFASQEKLVTALLQVPALVTEISSNSTYKEQLSLTLISSCYRGFSNVLLEKLMKMGADLNYKDDGKIFEKYYDVEPAEHGVIGLQDFLSIELDEDMAELIADDYCSPLSAAVTKGNLENVEFLLSKGAFVLNMSKHGKTVFHIGVEVGNLSVLKCLLQRASNQEVHCESHDTTMRLLGMQAFPEDGPCVIWSNSFRVPEERVDGKHLKHFLNKETFWHFSNVTPIFMTTNPEIIQLLVEKGADINHKSRIRGRSGVTPLLYMAENDILTVPILQTLFRCGGDLNATDLIGMNVLHYCIKNKQGSKNLFDVVDWLLQYGVDVNNVDVKGRTPLMRTVNHLPIPRLVRIFLSYGADINKQDSQGATVLHYCARKWVLDSEIWQLLLDGGGDINKKDKEGKTPLFYATDHKTAKKIVEAGGDHSLTDQNGNNAFLSAMSSDRCVQYLKQLKSIGTDVHSVDESGRNALSLYFSRLTKWYLRKDVLMFLLQEGISVNCADKEGRISLHHIITRIPEMYDREKSDSTKFLCSCITKLISHGVNVNSKDHRGITPLMLLLGHTLCPLDVLQLLLENGAAVDCQDQEGMTPLHHCLSNVLITAIRKTDSLQRCNQYSSSIGTNLQSKNYPTGHLLAVLRLLVQHKADVNCFDKQKRSPLAVALRGGCTISEVDFLLTVGADLTVQDQEGQTLMYHCLHSGLLDHLKVDLLQFLFEKNKEFFRSKLNLVNGCYNTLLSNPKSTSFLISQGMELKCSEILLKEVASTIENEEESGILKTLKLLFPAGFAGIDAIKNKTAPLTHISFYQKKLEVLKHLLANGYDQTVVDEKGNTLLHIVFGSLASGNDEKPKELSDNELVDIVSAVSKGGVDVNARNSRGETPLMLACMMESLKPQSIFKLLENEADPSALNKQNKSPLHLLLETAEKYQSKVQNKLTVFFFGSSNQDEPMDMSILSCIVLYLTSHGANVSQRDCDGNTPLVAALSITPFQFDIVNHLVDSGADLNDIDSHGNTGLHFIVQALFGDELVEAIVCQMIEKGADVMKKNKTNLKAIDIAATFMYAPRIHTCLQLLKHDGTPDPPLDHLQVMLHHSAMHSMAPDDVRTFLGLVQFLQKFGLDVNNKYPLNNMTFLMKAASVLNDSLVNGLLSLGANPNLADIDGYTALHHVLFSAELFQEWHRLSMFLKQDPDYDIDEQMFMQGPWNMPPKERRNRIKMPFIPLSSMFGTTWEDIEYCKQSKTYHLANAMLKILLNHAADANIKDFYGKSPLQYAVETPVHDLFACKAILTLIKGGASVNDRDLAGRTPLLTCLTHKGNRSERVAILLKSGADILAIDNLNRGILYYTDQANKRRCLESLVKKSKSFSVDMMVELMERSSILSGPDSDEETDFCPTIQQWKACLDP